MSEQLRPMATTKVLDLVRQAGHEPVRARHAARGWDLVVTTAAGETVRACRLTGRVTAA